MQKHTKIYLKHFGYTIADFVPCECCGAACVDVHHIECKGMGGSKEKDDITNLMALCREHHLEYGDKKQYKEYLKEVHRNKLKRWRDY